MHDEVQERQWQAGPEDKRALRAIRGPLPVALRVPDTALPEVVRWDPEGHHGVTIADSWPSRGQMDPEGHYCWFLAPPEARWTPMATLGALLLVPGPSRGQVDLEGHHEAATAGPWGPGHGWWTPGPDTADELHQRAGCCQRPPLRVSPEEDV